MPRFFVSRDDIDLDGGTLRIRGDDSRHVARSLRMAVGERVTVCDGDGTEYICSLSSVRDDETVCRILSKSRSEAESPVFITVFQALVKGDRMDTVIQKSVEFGASEIVPFEGERSIVRLRTEADGNKKTERRRRISAEAAKQCGRGKIPAVSEPLSFEAMLEKAGECDTCLFCYEEERTQTLSQALASVGDGVASIGIVVGPEGGFSPREAQAIAESGAISVSLGKRILRTESAAAFVLACLSMRFEL